MKSSKKVCFVGCTLGILVGFALGVVVSRPSSKNRENAVIASWVTANSNILCGLVPVYIELSESPDTAKDSVARQIDRLIRELRSLQKSDLDEKTHAILSNTLEFVKKRYKNED